jgi:hypothetical protein
MFMKKTFYILLSIISIISLTTSTTSFAAIEYIPKSISIEQGFSHKAGDMVNITLTNGPKPIGLQTQLEYGIAKAVEIEGYTFFETITTEYKDLSVLSDVSKLSTRIPNILEEDATSTYVVYTKFAEKNNPENENFYFTKEFIIQANETPFTQIGNINFLQSNGNRFSTTHGPSIYSPVDAGENKELATSTSIEVTFESNQDTVITPQISFSKLRSGTFSQNLTLAPITIKKGKTYAVIPLPTFKYEPGVYIGSMSFANDIIKNKVDFQYIVAGDSVSVGTVSAITKDLKNFFKFEIFGNPVDMDRSDFKEEATSTPLIYKTIVDFLDSKAQKIYSVTQDVDFNTNDFSIEIPTQYKDIAQLHVTVVSATGKVVYEGTKDVQYTVVEDTTKEAQRMIYIGLYILLICITVFAIYRRHIKTAIFCAVLILGMFAAKDAFANLIDIRPYRTHSVASVFEVEGHAMAPSMWLQDDVVNTIHACGESISVTFKAYYLRCTNSVPNMQYGFAWTSVKPVLVSGPVAASQNTLYTVTNGHAFYKSYSHFISKIVPPPPTPTATMYIRLYYKASGGDTTTQGYAFYQLPIQTSCTPDQTVCTCEGRTQACYQNGTQVSSTANAPSCALQASCSYSISADNKYAIFETIATNNIKTITYKDTNTGATLTKIFKRLLKGTSTISHNVTVTDSFDKTQAYASCSTAGPSVTVGGPGIETSTSTTKVPVINSFKSEKPVVPKGTSCQYSWNVEDVDRCSLSINGGTPTDVSPTFTSLFSVGTTNGLNQRAVITCIADASTSSPATTLSTTTLCQVVPEIVER